MRRSGKRSIAVRRQRSVRSSSLKVNTCKPAILAAGSSHSVSSRRISGSGENVRVISRRSHARCARRNRADSPSPIFIEIRSSLAWSTMPGTPIQIGSVVPRSRTFPTHAAIVSGSKQIWLTMWVASGAFSNIAWIVVSSLMKWWLSG